MEEENIPAEAIADTEETLLAPVLGGDVPILPAAAAPVRETIGDYEVLAKLGAGGMGAVYRARQVSLGRTVALKILPAHMIEDEDSVARFQREARVAASLTHPNLVRVYAAGEAAGCHFIAMELIEGEDLGRRLRRDGALPAVEALRITAEVARGLDHAWRTAHLIHRDIKPANIFLAADGGVKVGDLGLAKSILGNTTGLTQTGTMMGTPHYISPEQARADKEIDCRADIYSLGCTLFQMLTGRVPYAGTDAITIIRQHLDAPLPAILKAWPQCPVPLARLIGRMLKKSRHERPANYQELLAQIEAVSVHVDPASSGVEGTSLSTSPDLASSEADVAASPDRAERAPNVARATPPRVSGGAVAARLPTSQPRSKLLLYGGLAAGFLLFVIGSVFFVLPKAEKHTPARPKDEVLKQPQAPPRKPLVADQWIDLLSKRDGLELAKNTAYAAEGLQVSPAGFATVIDSALHTDGALRMTTTLDSEVLTMSLRTRARDGSAYWLTMKYPEIRLERQEPGKGFVVLDSYPVPATLQPGMDYQLEIRVVGSKITSVLDGAVLGEVEDNSLTGGSTGVLYGASGGMARKTVLLKALQFLSLDR